MKRARVLSSGGLRAQRRALHTPYTGDTLLIHSGRLSYTHHPRPYTHPLRPRAQG
jgi:hypothetical protein